ncbi:MAG: acid phosphatase [Magnetococcales bacterium]|nr:acid phosphatase [Magnetococcales bacterium]
MLLMMETTASAQAIPPGMEQIEHIVVLYMENRSFDNMFALFPGASGLKEAERAPVQVDWRSGRDLVQLPRVMNTNVQPAVEDARFPKTLPNRPWPIDDFVSHNDRMPNLIHEFHVHQYQINGGRNDLFASLSGGLTMGYHDTRSTRLWALAAEYTLADNFFQAAFGGSFLNHMWLACACTPVFPDAPDQMRVKLDEKGILLRSGQVTPDGYAVNTLEPRGGPHLSGSGLANLLPPQTAPTIGDRLSEKGISWAWYSGGWDDAENGNPGADFQYHHQPYAFFARYARGTNERAEHIRDDTQLVLDLKVGKFPQVVFVKPRGLENQHPGYANLADGDRYIGNLVSAIQASSYWPKTAIIVTYDEFGGLWDHVPPPKGDRWGPGTRIPAVVISPFARRGYVDHTQYDTTSVLKTIEVRFGIEPLTDRDRAAAPMLQAFAFGQTRSIK